MTDPTPEELAALAAAAAAEDLEEPEQHRAPEPTTKKRHLNDGPTGRARR